MAIPFLNNINLDDNQLQNAKLHVKSSAPTAAQGQIYFDSTDNVAKYHDGTSWINIPRRISVGGTPLAYSQAIDIVAGTNVSVAESTGTITISSTDQFTGTVTSVATANSTFISGSGGPITTSGTLTFSLSATGTPSSSTFLRGDNTWDVPSYTTITTTDGTYINLTPNSATSGAVTVTADLSAVDGTAAAGERYLTKNNTWATVASIPGTYTFDVSDGTNSETINSGDTVTWSGTGTTTVTYATATNTFTINSADQYTGTVTSVGLSMPSAFTVTNSPITSSGTLTVTGAGTVSQYIDGTGALQTFPADPTITLTGEVTGSGTTSITTTVANNVLDIDNFTAATIVTEAEGIGNNDNDTTIPTSAAVKDYVDTSIVGGLVYQGGYNASTNTPDLTTSPNSIKKGWTYTVTTAGTFFTTEVLEIGDVLIAEIDNPSSLADWTTVQNNTDLASLTQVGIGNVNAGTGISVSYSSGTATVTNTDTNSANTYATTITDTATITHSLNTRDVIIELYDTVTYETVYADVVRTSTTTATITFATTPTNSIRVLVQKIG